MNNKRQKIGTLGLTAFVLSAMVGGGIYDLPQNMSLHAGLIGQLLAWALAGAIIWCIVKSFLVLSEVRPDFTTGLYKYAHAGFGNFTAFFVSWGYWICQAFAVGAYAVLIMSTMNAFWPGVFTGGNNWPSVIGGSIILWVMTSLILKGIKTTSAVDIIGTALMLGIVVIFIITMLVAFKWQTFTVNAFANHNIPKLSDHSLGSLFSQIKGSMLVTLWVFAGVETAVVLSGSAKSQKDVRHATRYGFLICLVIYILVSILPLGLRTYGQIANMATPSTATLMAIVMGPIGRLIITFGVIVAVLSSWMSWELVLSEMPRAASEDGTFPKIFNKTNKKGIATTSLIATACLIEGIILFTHFATRAFDFSLTIVATMTVPPYLISMMYLTKISWKPQTFNPKKLPVSISRKNALITSILAIIGTLFMGYTAGIKYLTIAFVFYALGIPLFMYARKEYDPKQPIFGKYERWFALIIVIVAAVGLYMLFK